MSSLRRRMAGAMLLATIWGAAGCGVHTSPVAPSPSPTPTVPATPASPLERETFAGTVPAFQVSRHGWTATRAGTVSVSLTWTDPAVDLDLYLAPAACVTLYPHTACGVLSSSRAAAGTSEALTASVQANQPLALFVDNLDLSSAQGYTLTVGVR